MIRKFASGSANVPDIGGSTVLEPDKGGLNIEGLGFDPNTNTLLLGVRTPVIKGQAIVVPVRINDLAGPWDASNLSVQPLIHLAIEAARDEQGIRDLSYDPVKKGFLVVVGNSTSLSKAPFMVYRWDGATTAVQKLGSLFFAKGAKPEGVTRATFGTASGLVFVDDNGGFRSFWTTIRACSSVHRYRSDRGFVTFPFRVSPAPGNAQSPFLEPRAVASVPRTVPETADSSLAVQK
ncbi:MAG: DUF3616 domain-containing protein [Blastocatellia bacterium]|nr:DUF3616 domain-containing protein [Blastocatellia bacterium]